MDRADIGAVGKGVARRVFASGRPKVACKQRSGWGALVPITPREAQQALLGTLDSGWPGFGFAMRAGLADD